MNIIEFLFNCYKETIIIPKKFKKEISEKYNISSNEVHDLWIRINNYQIKKYGQYLTTESNILSSEECNRLRINANQRIYKR